jgi:hypothetical protein
MVRALDCERGQHLEAANADDLFQQAREYIHRDYPEMEFGSVHSPFTPSEVVEHFRIYYGVTNQASTPLDAARQHALRRDLEHLWAEHNSPPDGTTRYESEYLEAVAVRRLV